ncbi:type II toxin-antitoxin system RelE/ParE family toxin [Vagococcus sp. BWB3-3]|uniref:Type II toxin-antitoxin system RelE/ParE family toxin n=1 Tax=Vagococcus allomyrinae TaxID=2794353 RepID=A0A940P130_9ENTE|nr:type II toxin-antitoxin system RelE/ParE family toxin [Vagococcus allomyrinae]MBP1039514.1 type II toxin-antitoxin system RelE/ParE family toxin [Vagococcus allomyrinae]
MPYQVRTTEHFDKQLSKLDKFTGRTILKWLAKNIEGMSNLRATGKSLVGNYVGKWRYQVGDYRIICQIEDDQLIVLTLEVGHRKKVYKS